jgi:ATP:ADP antiporter, AAA family
LSASTANPEASADAPGPLGPVDRFLNLFSDVHAGEGTTALLMLGNLFLLLVGYYVLKTVREPLILAEGGAELASYASAGQAVALMGFIPLYSWFSSRVDRLKLIVGVILFFAVCIELFYVGALLRVPYVGVAFYIWLGIYNMAIIAQFWSYANDIYRRGAGERLFPIIALGATAGSPLGALVAEQLFGLGVKAYQMFHLTAGLLIIHLLLYWVVDRRQTRARGPAGESAPPLPGPGGFTLILRSPYLRLFAGMMILLNAVNSTGEYIIRRAVSAAADTAAAAGADREAFIGAFSGSYLFWVSVGALVLQAFVVSRIVKYLGVKGVVLALPLVALGAYSLIGAGVGFAIVRWAKTAENATDYSVMNTGKHILWLPTRREEKYKAKQANDTFFVRLGDLLSAGVVFVGTTYFALGIRGAAMVNVTLIAVWLAVAVVLLRHYRELSTDHA